MSSQYIFGFLIIAVSMMMVTSVAGWILTRSFSRVLLVLGLQALVLWVYMAMFMTGERPSSTLLMAGTIGLGALSFWLYRIGHRQARFRGRAL